MNTARVIFRQCVQIEQVFGSEDPNQDYMVCEMLFTLIVGDRIFEDNTVKVKQPYGTRFEDEPLEVERFNGPYQGPFNHAGFQEVVEAYYRHLFGSKGKVIRVEPGASGTGINNVFAIPFEGQFQIED